MENAIETQFEVQLKQCMLILYGLRGFVPQRRRSAAIAVWWKATTLMLYRLLNSSAIHLNQGHFSAAAASSTEILE